MHFDYDFAGHATTAAYVEAGLGPGDDRHRARHMLEELGLTGEELPADLQEWVDAEDISRTAAPATEAPRTGDPRRWHRIQGKTVRLRITSTDNRGPLRAVVDDVRFEKIAP